MVARMAYGHMHCQNTVIQEIEWNLMKFFIVGYEYGYMGLVKCSTALMILGHSSLHIWDEYMLNELSLKVDGLRVVWMCYAMKRKLLHILIFCAKWYNTTCWHADISLLSIIRCRYSIYCIIVCIIIYSSDIIIDNVFNYCFDFWNTVEILKCLMNWTDIQVWTEILTTFKWNLTF